MTDDSYPPLHITPIWSRVNEQIIDLVDLIPDDQMNWSPKPELHNFRGILIHISMSRHGWLGWTAQDGEAPPDVLREGQTGEGLKEQLRLSWARMERFLSDEEKLAGTYEDDWWQEGGSPPRNGHWLAFHGLEHDIHHRADIFHYLALLGIEHGSIHVP